MTEQQIIAIANSLLSRADAYEEPYQGNATAFVQSGSSYAIATALREIGWQLKKLDKP